MELGNKTYLSLNKACEPFLTKHELYSTIGVTINNLLDTDLQHTKKEYLTLQDFKITGKDIDIILWLMFYGDGENNLLKISNKVKINIYDLYRVAKILTKLKLLKEL
jgi:aminopeptidase-like protein